MALDFYSTAWTDFVGAWFVWMLTFIVWRAGPHSPLLLGTKVEIDLCDPKVWRYTPLVLMPGRQRQIDLCDLKAW